MAVAPSGEGTGKPPKPSPVQQQPLLPYQGVKQAFALAKSGPRAVAGGAAAAGKHPSCSKPRERAIVRPQGSVRR